MSTETETESVETTVDKTAAQGELFAKALEESSRKADERQAALVEELRAQNKAIQAATAVKPSADKVFNDDELQALYDEKRITLTQMNSYIAKREAQAAAAATKEEIAAQLQDAVGANAINAKIAKYADAIPALNDRNSDDFKEFASVYNELVSEGKPKSVATELDALRAIYGRDPSKHAKNTVTEKTSERRTQETTGSRSSKSTSGNGKSSKGVPTWLPDNIRAHYEVQLEKGRYKGPNDPNFIAEMKIAERKYKSA